MSWSEKFFEEVGVRGEPIADSSDSPSKTAPFNSLRPRACSDYFSLEDIVVFWCYGAYKKYRDHMELTTGFAAITDTVLPAGTVGRGHP